MEINAADRTQQYFSEIGRSFMDASFFNQASWQVIVILSIVVCVLIGVIVFMWLRGKQNNTYIPPGWVLDPTEIHTMLDNAVLQRSRFEVQFHSEQERRRSTYCSVYKLTPQSMVLECAGLRGISNRWIGRVVDCYFRVQTNGTNTFYKFTTAISGIRSAGTGISHITLEMPDKLELRQKREYLRVSPPEQYILGLAIWPEITQPDGTPLMDIKRWGRPALTFIPGKLRQLTLHNISAGGVKLLIPKEAAKQCNLPFNIADHVMLLLDLWEPENGQRDRYWLHCRIQNVFVDFDSQDVEIGIQFRSQATFEEGSNHKLEWIPNVPTGEVEEVGNWAMRRHLELYREKGLE